MPQIWMTYHELGTLCGWSAADARLQAQELVLDRRRSRDGHTRVKLNLALMARFFETIRDTEFDLDEAIAALRDTHQKMSGVFANRPAGLGREVA